MLCFVVINSVLLNLLCVWTKRKVSVNSGLKRRVVFYHCTLGNSKRLLMSMKISGLQFLIRQICIQTEMGGGGGLGTERAVRGNETVGVCVCVCVCTHACGGESELCNTLLNKSVVRSTNIITYCRRRRTIL